MERRNVACHLMHPLRDARGLPCRRAHPFRFNWLTIRGRKTPGNLRHDRADHIGPRIEFTALVEHPHRAIRPKR